MRKSRGGKRERERKRIERTYAVGRLRYCDANVSNRSNQPTICPFVHRGVPDVALYGEVHAKPDH